MILRSGQFDYNANIGSGDEYKWNECGEKSVYSGDGFYDIEILFEGDTSEPVSFDFFNSR